MNSKVVNDLVKSKASQALGRLHKSKPSQAVVVASLVLATQLCPSIAFADDGFSTITTSLQTVLTYVTGSFGKVVAGLSIVVMGIMALAGRLPMSLVLNALIGIGLIFGASSILNNLIGSSG